MYKSNRELWFFYYYFVENQVSISPYLRLNLLKFEFSLIIKKFMRLIITTMNNSKEGLRNRRFLLQDGQDTRNKNIMGDMINAWRSCICDVNSRQVKDILTVIVLVVWVCLILEQQLDQFCAGIQLFLQL